MKYRTKKIFNKFDRPGGIARGCDQIGPVVFDDRDVVRSGAWVYRNNNNTSNCATNCANNCANNVRSWTGFRRAMMSSQIPNFTMDYGFAELGGSMQKYCDGRYQEGQTTEPAFMDFSMGYADRVIAVGMCTTRSHRQYDKQ